MLDILPALLWIIAAVIAVNICLITAIRGNLFSKKHGFLGEVPAFLRTCRMAIGCGDGHADRSGTCFHVSSGPKRHAQRDGAEAQSGRQIEI